MDRVMVLGTGGTIASSSYEHDAGSVANRSIGELLGSSPAGQIEIESRDVLRTNSFLLTFGQMRLIAEAVNAELARPEVVGVVVTHGTDTMEETAFLLDLVHHSPKPVVLTGAQNAADRPDADGPRNLRDAVMVAAAPQARRMGALICFAGRIYPARYTRKFHTTTLEPFDTVGAGPLGRVHEDAVVFTAQPVRTAPLPLPDRRFDAVRVDIVTAYPGMDSVLAEAAVRAGAAAVVVAGMGSGNGNRALLDWVREAVQAGLVVGLSTRVPYGPVQQIYGNGGGVDLVAAGALPLGQLPPSQGRVLLAVLLAQGGSITAQTLALHG